MDFEPKALIAEKVVLIYMELIKHIILSHKLTYQIISVLTIACIFTHT
jgi:hypothetical protein